MPIHTHILENIHALLDFNRISRMQDERVQQFSSMFGLSIEEGYRVLGGEQVPNRHLLKEIANRFEVDHHWLLKN